MAIQLRPDGARAFPLLLEPDPYGGRAHAAALRMSRTGYRRVDGELVRHHSDDPHGALVQHAIVRYYVHGVGRAQLARETNFSERQVQGWLSGTASRAYAAPVLRALDELGIGRTRAGSSAAQPADRRNREIIAALLALVVDGGWLLARDTRPAAERFMQRARLLTAGREALG